MARLSRCSRGRRALHGLSLLAGLMLAGCASDLRPGPPWISAHGLEHPLTGRIWDREAERFIAPEAMLGALARADFVLLGEKHDNADHHRLQAWLVSRLAALDRRPAVAFEMLTREQEAPLARYLATHPGDAAGIGEAVAWGKTGWPPWPQYQPIAAAALADEAPLLAASLPRTEIRALAREGLASLGEARVQALGLETELPAAAVARLRGDIIAAHCGELPAAMTEPMVVVQRVKDAEMAATLQRGLALAGRTSAVLIAGNGHVRRDYGVPWHLGRLAAGRRAVVVAMLEVDGEASEVADYAGVYGAALPFDFVWFTPALELEDACEKYAEALRRAKARHDKGKKD